MTPPDNNDDDVEKLVQQVLAENPVEDRGVREEWNEHVGWHRKEDVSSGLRGGGVRYRGKEKGKLSHVDGPLNPKNLELGIVKQLSPSGSGAVGSSKRSIAIEENILAQSMNRHITLGIILLGFVAIAYRIILGQPRKASRLVRNLDLFVIKKTQVSHYFLSSFSSDDLEIHSGFHSICSKHEAVVQCAKH